MSAHRGPVTFPHHPRPPQGPGPLLTRGCGPRRTEMAAQGREGAAGRSWGPEGRDAVGSSGPRGGGGRGWFSP